jgi:hypothetical protein
MEDFRVVFYLDKVAPLTYDYFDIVNFNTYLRAKADELPVCCKDRTAQCMACQKQTTVGSICKQTPTIKGCPKPKNEPICC